MILLIFLFFYADDSVHAASSSVSTGVVMNTPLDIDNILWRNVPNRILNLCETEELVIGSNRSSIIQIVAEYMVGQKNTSRKRATEFSTLICRRYPYSFCDTVGGKVVAWSDGISTVRQQILNAVTYKNKKLNRGKKRDNSQESLKIMTVMMMSW